MAKHGKKYLEARARIDRDREYDPAEAIRLVKEIKTSKADETLEVHLRTGLNVRHADEQLRGTIALPHGLGKDVKIAVFARGDKAQEAEAAGADYVGAAALAARLQDEGFTDFAVPKDEFRTGYLRLVDHAIAGEITFDIETYPLEQVATAWERQAAGPAAKIVVSVT